MERLLEEISFTASDSARRDGRRSTPPTCASRVGELAQERRSEQVHPVACLWSNVGAVAPWRSISKSCLSRARTEDSPSGCLAFPAASRKARIRDEALHNIREAIELYLEPVEDDAMLPAGAEVTELRL